MNLAQLNLRLEEASSLQEIRACFSYYLKQFSIISYALTYYSGHVKTGRKLQYHCVSKSLEPWHLHYIEQGYANVDRTLEGLQFISVPIAWDVKEQLNAAKNNRERRIRLESLEFGIEKGLSIPIHGPHEDFATLTLYQSTGENWFTDYFNHRFEWQSAALLFYHYIKRLLKLEQSNLNQYQLTKREQQCLNLTAKSLRVEQIAKELKISMRTVNFHLQNANKKMGTNNKYLSVFRYVSNN